MTASGASYDFDDDAGEESDIGSDMSVENGSEYS